MDFRVIIPARFKSNRLPGKVLMDIAGKPMLQHTYEKAIQSGAESTVIAVDDERIAQAAEKFGATVCMTSVDHQSGTERLSEAVEALNYDKDEIVVCVQADEPLIQPELIRLVAQDMAEHETAKVTSVCEQIDDPEELFNPHAVKVVMNKRNFAMYFSRAPIPWVQGQFENRENIELTGDHYRHVGIYAYRAGFLQDYMDWAVCRLGEMEMLEQLRILWNGGRIHMRVSKHKAMPGVDTMEDLKRVRAYMKKKAK